MNSDNERPSTSTTNTPRARPPTQRLTQHHSTQNDHHQKEAFYIGAAENFKQRFRNHLKSFRNEAYRKETELSKFIWSLKDRNLNYKIDWKILRRTSGYNKVSKSCNLCISEKYEICKFRNKNILLNKRSELVSKCRHENKHLLANLPDP